MSDEKQDEQKPVKAISLLSGGLDSILATRIVQDQGVEVLALHYISPFFGAGRRGREAEVEAFYRDTYGINARVIDISDEFMRVVGNPRHGYGKNFNPCIDCKIFLFTLALRTMEEVGAKFLITGEVVGQRPMSQRRDAMNLIAKEIEAREILLRPLCAKRLEETLPEREGWVDREKLFDISGRSRKPQMALAQELGIGDYPTPAGGCSLTDPCLAARVRRYFDDTPEEERSAENVRMLLSGRPFHLPGGGQFTMGRSQGENNAILKLQLPGDEIVKVMGVPGPTGLYRAGRASPTSAESEREQIAAIMLRYCSKAGPGAEVGFGPDPDPETMEIHAIAKPVEESTLDEWRR